jgi:hypothetical protein
MISVKHFNINNEQEVENSILLVQNTHWGSKFSKEQLLFAFTNSDCFVAYLDNELVGFVRILSDGLYLSYIFDMVIREDLRAKGYGSIFIKEVFNNDKYKNTVWYLTTTNAKNFYKKFGFKELNNANGMVMLCPKPI